MRPAAPPRTRPLVLLGILTMLTFGGPLAIGLLLIGGDSDRWPPDRPVEWRGVIGTIAGFVVVFAACILDASRTLRAGRSESGDPK